MIIYDLECDAKHCFEGWFKNADEFSEQQQNGMLMCPICGSDSVRKLPSATYIGKASSATVDEKQSVAKSELNKHQALQFVHDYINKNFDDVGSQFAEEAKKIHYGESEQRNIRGTATADEIMSLKDEGVQAVQLPPAPYDKDKLN